MRGTLLASLLFVACGPEPAAADPVFEPLPGIEDVTRDLGHLVPGERKRVLYAPTDATAGAAEPLVTIVSFSDFQCPYCGHFARMLDELVRVYPDDVRIVFKQFPLPMHRDAVHGARAAIAAGMQGRFWAMHDRLFEHRHQMSPEALSEHAKALGLDVARFEADLEAPQTKARLEAELEQGRALGVRGTPTFFVNGRLVSGVLEPDAFRELIDSERAIAKQLLHAGSPRAEIYAQFMRATSPAVP